nr:hypothetical protein [Tanacetum cinerariifolium]
EPTIGGKSQSAVQRFLAGVVQHAEVRSGVMPTLPTYVPIMTSATTATPTANPVASANERLIGSSVFGGDSSSVGGSHPISAGFSDRTSGDFLVDARQISLIAEVRMRAEYNIKEKRRLKSVVEEKDVLLKSRSKKIELEVKVTDLAASVKVREQEVADLDDVVTFVKLQNDSLVDQVHELEASSAGLQEKVTVYENYMSQLEKFQDEKMKKVNEKFDKLCVDFVDMALHLEEKFYPHLLTTISGRRWLITHGMELAIAKCLNFTEYLFALGAAIGKAIEKGMQEGLSAANKDASVEVIMNLLHLDDALAEKLGLVELQPHVDQLMAPIHHSPDQHVVALRGVFVPLSEPLSAMALEGTSGAAPDTTMALSITSISASTISPIYTDDYEIAHTEGRDGTVTDVEAIVNEGEDPFPDVTDILCSRKGVSIAVSKPIRSFAQCFCDFIWSLPLRSELVPVFRMACLLSLFLQEIQADPQGFVILDYITFALLKVGMPISAGITASAPYVNENGFSPLLDLIMASVCPFYQVIGMGMLNEGEALADT